MCGSQVLVVNVKALVMHKLVCANQRVQSICLRSETSVLEQEISACNQSFQNDSGTSHARFKISIS